MDTMDKKNTGPKTVQGLYQIVKDSFRHHRIGVSNLMWNEIEKSDCFLARDFISWFTHHYPISKLDAVNYGQKLLDLHIFLPVISGEKLFKDEPIFFSYNSNFKEDESSEITLSENSLETIPRLHRRASSLGAIPVLDREGSPITTPITRANTPSKEAHRFSRAYSPGKISNSAETSESSSPKEFLLNYGVSGHPSLSVPTPKLRKEEKLLSRTNPPNSSVAITNGVKDGPPHTHKQRPRHSQIRKSAATTSLKELFILSNATPPGRPRPTATVYTSPPNANTTTPSKLAPQTSLKKKDFLRVTFPDG